MKRPDLFHLTKVAAVVLGVVSATSIAPACIADDSFAEEEDLVVAHLDRFIASPVVPADPETLFDRAAVCDQTLKRHVRVRERDLDDGSIRWACADVEGVETDPIPGLGRGQEYCEYHAVQGGKPVTRTSELVEGEPLFCYFTSVYFDFDGRNELDNPSKVPSAKDQTLANALSSESALAATVSADLVRMKIPINSRGAADTLIEDCAAIEPDLNEERQAACYLASLSNENDAAKLEKECSGKDLSQSARWGRVQRLGAEILEEGDLDYELQRDIIGCLALGRAKHGGVPFRNSDPTICGRVFRAKQECGCEWEPARPKDQLLPSSLQGFLFGSWSNDRIAPGCKRVKVNGTDSQQMAVCRVPDDEVEELPLDLDVADDLQKFCNDRFARHLVMRAPLRAVEVAGSCKTETNFCRGFAGKD